MTTMVTYPQIAAACATARERMMLDIGMKIGMELPGDVKPELRALLNQQLDAAAELIDELDPPNEERAPGR
jgi:hypothetical protein